MLPMSTFAKKKTCFVCSVMPHIEKKVSLEIKRAPVFSAAEFQTRHGEKTEKK